MNYELLLFTVSDYRYLNPSCVNLFPFISLFLSIFYHSCTNRQVERGNIYDTIFPWEQLDETMVPLSMILYVSTCILVQLLKTKKKKFIHHKRVRLLTKNYSQRYVSTKYVSGDS